MAKLPPLTNNAFEIRKNVLPITDLNMQGPGYGRYLDIPEDFFPALALMFGQGDDHPRTAQFTNQGRLKVDTGSSGGGGVSPVAMSNYWQNVSTNDGNYHQVSPNITISTLYGVAYYITLGGAGAMAFTNVPYETQLYFGSTSNPATANPFFVPPGVTYIGANLNPPGSPYYVLQWFPPIPVNMAAYTISGASQIWWRSQNYPATLDLHIYYT